MNHFLRVNLYEIQAILFWILAEILFKSGNNVLGWMAASYGWLTFIGAMLIAARHSEQIKKFFNEK